MHCAWISNKFYVRKFKINYRALEQLSLLSEKTEIKCFQNSHNFENEHINVHQEYSTNLCKDLFKIDLICR